MVLSRPFFLCISAFVAVLTLSTAEGGRAIPRGFRSWNTFKLSISQPIMEEIFDALASRNRSVDGVPTSFLDLGYVDVGLDDGWMLCKPGGGGYHDADGRPLVNLNKFPDLASMVQHGHAGVCVCVYGW